MIYELRVYQALPGQMAKLQARFRDQLPPIWEKHGIHAIGFWTTLVGESSNQLTYILQWESLADLETRWTAFLNDSAWHKVRDEGERDGPIVASISNQILTPTAFSVEIDRRNSRSRNVDSMNSNVFVDMAGFDFWDR